MDALTDLLLSGLARMGVEAPERARDKLFLYMDMLLEWNQKFNLTAITDRREIIIKHFLDSASILPSAEPYLEKRPRLADVGTGAGFPGIVVKILSPDIETVLIDSLAKRVGFLEAVVEGLGLRGVSCFHVRAEDAGHNPDFRESFGVCAARAVTNLSSLSEYCLPFAAVGGAFIAMKGPDVEAETAAAKASVKLLGGVVAGVRAAPLPFSDINHKIIIVEKIRKTPSKYPRKNVSITKSPIKFRTNHRNSAQIGYL
jgi:16S rRNA (guanine527-N7)-methyltransferase